MSDLEPIFAIFARKMKLTFPARFLLNNDEVNYRVSLEQTLDDYKNIKPFKKNIGQNLFFTETAATDEFGLVITIGGDGTILWAHKLLNREELPPFLCFNGGSLCFLSNFALKNVNTVMNEMHQKVKDDEPFEVFNLPRIKSYVSFNSKF